MARRKKHSAAFSLFAFQDIITSVTGIMILVTLILALELTERIEAHHAPAQASIDEIEETVQATRELARKAGENQDLIDELKKNLKAGRERISGSAGYDPSALKNQLGNSLQINADLEGEIEVLERDLAQAMQDLGHVQTQQAASTDRDEALNLQQRIVALNKQLQELRASNRVIYNPTKGDAKKPWLVEIAKGTIRVAEAGLQAAPIRFDSPVEFEQWLGTMNANDVYFVILPKPSGIDEFLAIRQLIKTKGFDRGYDLLTEEQSAVGRSNEEVSGEPKIGQ